MPKAVFYSELRQGKRDRGAPRKRFKGQLKRQLSQANSDWKQLAENRAEWRDVIKTASEKKAVPSEPPPGPPPGLPTQQVQTFPLIFGLERKRHSFIHTLTDHKMTS